ncbi:hypothetical protein KGQ19_07320 [Catenulispora sp. NL8]|uniref:Uncharacterized protein n=1 Tax=Catenulispora pinistramenti TaxID=2705254 RepID=A0ABS5KKX0_9ACTN|nr:hypothetical protein [Catenulispora pinistramenti]MBS2546674.1 hypothetical protein [Catenulispora pinistramenti]
MGTDISGWIEILTEDWNSGDIAERWLAVVDLGHLYLGRDYDAFGCLFGVRNFAGFRPLAADRGLPEDASAKVQDECEGIGGHSPTWISWAELAVVDWAEPAVRVDERVHKYRRLSDGSLQFVSKAAYDGDLEKLIGSARGPGESADLYPEGTEWTDGDTVYRVERLRRSDAVAPDGEWRPVWAVMEALASVHDPEKVRLVVCFDS